MDSTTGAIFGLCLAIGWFGQRIVTLLVQIRELLKK